MDAGRICENDLRFGHGQDTLDGCAVVCGCGATMASFSPIERIQ